jgi:outer membrane protein OmpA-like peptidoglycan-associated protein
MGSRFWYVCKIKNLCGEVSTTVEDIRPRTLNLKDGDQVILENYEQFSFPKNEVNPKLSPNNTEFLDQLASHLKQNQDKSLKITGNFRESEEGIKAGFYDNLGIARANKIKEALVARGVNENQFSIGYNKVRGESLLEPATFEILGGPSEFDTKGERLAEMKFTFNDMTFTESNFDFGSYVFKPGSAFKTYADSVKTYLSLNPEQVLTIIGHTDKIGTDTYNDKLGSDRAKSVREYFRNLGVTAKINIGSKGKREPVAPNDTDANRQKNRRVNVKIE